MSRKPSKASQRELAKLLKDLGISCENFERLLPPGLSLPKAGRSIDDLLDCVAFLADQGEMTGEILDTLEEAYPRRRDEFKRIRVDMEFIDPRQPLLARPKLDAIKASARKGGLHEGLGYAQLKARLPAKVWETASTSLQAPEQLDAWFDAANRQRLEPGDKPCMIGLLEVAVEVAEDDGKMELRDALNRLRLEEPSDPRDLALTDADKSSLEKIVQTYGIMLSAGGFSDRVMTCLARTCLVRVGGFDMGTGFLVGDDLVLTAYHVLSNAISGSTDPASVEFHFDYREKDGRINREGPRTGLSLAGRSDRDPLPWLIDASPPTAEELKPNGRPDIKVATDANKLDFALVRIADALGKQRGPGMMAGRGYFEIAPEAVPFDFPTGTALMIFGHPIKEGGGQLEASPQVFSLAPDAVIETNPNLTRVRYRTNTRGGSSGSPVLTTDGRVVALHHFGKTGEYNQGIPMTAIVARSKVGAVIGAGKRTASTRVRKSKS